MVPFIEPWRGIWALEIVASLPSSWRRKREEGGPAGEPRRRRGDRPEGAAPTRRSLRSGKPAGKPFPPGRAAGRGRGAVRRRPRGGPSAWQPDRRPRRELSSPASAAGLAGRPHSLAMRPLLLLAPLAWLLLAKAKDDAKPEGEGAGRGGRGDPGWFAGTRADQGAASVGTSLCRRPGLARGSGFPLLTHWLPDDLDKSLPPLGLWFPHSFIRKGRDSRSTNVPVSTKGDR